MVTITRDSEEINESDSGIVSSRVSARSVAYHRHCQNTILPILGHNDTSNALNGFSSFKSMFTSSGTITDDFISVLQLINGIYEKSGRTTLTIHDHDHTINTGCTLFPDSELSVGSSNNTLEIGRTVSLDVGGAELQFGTLGVTESIDKLSSSLPKKNFIFGDTNIGEVVVPPYESWSESGSENIVISANSLVFQMNGREIGTVRIVMPTSTSINLDLDELDNNKLICDNVLVENNEAELNLTDDDTGSRITGFRVDAEGSFNPVVNLNDYWIPPESDTTTNPNEKHVIQVQMFVKNVGSSSISVKTPKVGDQSGFSRMYSKIDIVPGQKATIKITIDLGRQTISQETVYMFPPVGERMSNPTIFTYNGSSYITGYSTTASTHLGTEIYDTYALGVGSNALNAATHSNMSPTQIYLPYVSKVEENAFIGCSNLTDIALDNAKTIGNYAFANCNSTEFKQINLPVATTIGSSAFASCSYLEHIYLPGISNASDISECAFYNCVNLKTVNFSSLEFGDINGSLEAWEFPSNVLLICKNETLYSPPRYMAYNGINSSQRLITKTIATPPNDVVDKFTRGTVDYWFPNVVFKGNTTITSVDFPNAEQIGSSSFQGCTNLTFVSLDNVETIGSYAFQGCNRMTKLNIGSKLNNIGTSAFLKCTGLTGDGVYINDLDAWFNINFEDADSNPLNYSKKLYLNGQQVTELTIPDSVSEINPFAFYNCSSITSIVIPVDLIDIGNDAFYGCSGITKVTIVKLHESDSIEEVKQALIDAGLSSSSITWDIKND